MKNFYLLVIAALIAVILVQRACNNSSELTPIIDTVTVYDTTYKQVEKVIYKKPKLFSSDSSFVNIDPVYLPDTNYAALKIQFETLVNSHTVKNIYQDSIKLDSLGYVSLTDTVQFNSIIGRKIYYDYKIPTVYKTTTITKTAPQKRQLFIGGSLSLNKQHEDLFISTGLLYKNKKDHIIGITAGTNTEGLLYYGIQSYWKIKF